MEASNVGSVTPSPTVTSSFRRSAHRAGGLALLGAITMLMVLPAIALTTAALAPGFGAPRAAPIVAVHPAAHLAPGVATFPAHGRVAPSVLAEQRQLMAGRGAPSASLAGVRSGFTHPAAGGSPSNFYIDDYGTTVSIAQDGASNSTLAVGMSNGHSFTNGSTIAKWGTQLAFSGYFWQHGLTATAYSTNGGQGWTWNSPGLNKSWTTPSSTTYQDVPAGDAVIAGNHSGTVAVIESFFATCLLFTGPPSPDSLCNLTSAYATPSGVAVARSTDGGTVWGQPAVLWQGTPYDNISVNFGGCGPAYGYLNGNYSLAPTIWSSGTTGDMIASWTIVFNNWAGDFTCNPTTGGYNYNLRNPIAYNVVSYSSDGGATWSAPLAMSDNNSAWVALSGSSTGSGTEYMAFEDYNNGTAAGQVAVDFASSTTGGQSWSTPGAVSVVYPVNSLGYYSVSPGGTQVKLAVDNNAGSPYYGTIYLVYADNRSASNGYASVLLTSSSDGGAAWSNPVYVTPNIPTSTQFVIPNVAVDPSGRVWVTFYASNLGDGNYVESAVTSSDGGATWSAPFNVADAVSTPPPSSLPFGGIAGLVATSAGVYPAWEDCRTAACTSPTVAYDFTSMVAQFHAVPVGSNAPGVTATITSIGNLATVAAPGVALLENGSSVTVQVPSVVPDNSSYVYAFAGFSGALSSANNPATFTYSGTGTINATYVPAPAAWIEGYVGPVVPGLAVMIGSTSVPLTPYNTTADSYLLTVEAGPSYTVSASAGANYVPQSKGPYPTTAHVAQYVNITLARQWAYLNGTVTAPTSAASLLSSVHLTVNGSMVPVSSRGTFSYLTTWGIFTVAATLPGYTSFNNANQILTPKENAQITVPLDGGYLNGTVSPRQANVQINGTVVTPDSTGSFSADLAGGTYRVTAQLSSYSFYSRDITVTPGAGVAVQIILGTSGWINGSFSPASAQVMVNNRFIAIHQPGLFNDSITGNQPHVSLEVELPGYTPFFGNYSVTVGNATNVPLITLQKSSTPPPPTCPNASNPACNKGGGGNGNGGNDLLLYALIGVLVAVVVGLAVLMMMRRRPGSGASAPPAEPEQGTYDGSSPSNLPKLQSDGSMTYDEGQPPNQ